MGRYILVLKIVDKRPDTPKTITEPDVEKLGGPVLSKHDFHNRRVINLPPAAAQNLRGDKNVAYLQRVWMGEPLDTWDERDVPAGSSLKARSDDVTGTSLNWSTGAFQCDPSGNIKAMGADTYAYDSANGLVKAVVNGEAETYGYDSFGNLTQKALAGQTSTIPAIDSASNRLAGEAYDAAGNVTTNGSTMRYEFDSVGAMSTMITKGGQRRRMIYTADDERIGEAFETKIRWKIREVNGAKVLREFQDDGSAGGGAWEWTEDYVYAGGTLVGAETEQFWGGKRHFHLDHLGSVRMITNDSKMRYSRNDYYPFGKEQSSAVQESTNFGYWRSDPMKFTGHEREYYGFSNVENGDYLDYMHARFYSPNMGRFLSVDPVMDLKKTIPNPQKWNRYSYVRNKPINAIDPDGRDDLFIGDDFRDPFLAARSHKQYISNEEASIGISFIPGHGDAYDAISAIRGRDLLTDQKIGTFARIAGVLLPFVGVGGLNKVSEVFRGGSNMIAAAKDVKIIDGLVQTTHGVSLNKVASEVAHFEGGAYRVTSIPDGLKIIQRGTRIANHLEIVPKKAMSMEDYEKLLNEVKLEKVQ